jgi:hypothetical protein
VGNRSLYQVKLRRNNTSGSVIEDPRTHFQRGAKVKTFGDLENSSKSKRLKSLGGGALSTVGSRWRFNDRLIRVKYENVNIAYAQEGKPAKT